LFKVSLWKLEDDERMRERVSERERERERERMRERERNTMSSPKFHIGGETGQIFLSRYNLKQWFSAKVFR